MIAFIMLKHYSAFLAVRKLSYMYFYIGDADNDSSMAKLNH